MGEPGGNAGVITEELPEEPHEDVWASMATVVVRDTTGPPQRPGQARGQTMVDSDTESSSSENSGDSGQRANTAEEDELALTLGDLLGGDPAKSESITLGDLLGDGAADDLTALAPADDPGDDGARLPSVEQAQRQLEDLQNRRKAIGAISSRYSPPRPDSGATPTADEPEVPAAATGGTLEGIGRAVALDGSGEALAASGPEEVGAPCDKEFVTSFTSLDALSTASPAEGAAPPAADELERKVTGTGDVPATATFSPMARYVAAEDSAVIVSAAPVTVSASVAPTQEESIAAVAADVSAALSSATSPTPVLRPSAVAAKAKASPVRFFGPGVKPDSGQTADVMRQLGDALSSFKLLGAAASREEDPIARNAPPEPKAPKAVAKVAKAAAPPPKSSPAPSRSPSIGPVPVDAAKFEVGRQSEEARMKELWHQFLPGDDIPVGSDDLPTPELFGGR